MATTHSYEVNLVWTGGRTGNLSAPQLEDTITCATPPEFPGGMAGLWSPEHLYAAAINSCFMATFLAIAANFRLPFTGFSCKTTCKLEAVEGRYQITEAVIAPEIQLTDVEADRDQALKVLDKAKAACLVTNSIKTAIIVNSRLV